MPERDFFFGILASLKTDYLKKIISDAHLARMKGEEDKETKEVIMIKQEWLDELNKYPHISSKTCFLHLFRKTWKRNLPHQRESQTNEGKEEAS